MTTTQHRRIQSVNVSGSTRQTLTASNQCKKLLCQMDSFTFVSETRKPALPGWPGTFPGSYSSLVCWVLLLKDSNKGFATGYYVRF